MILAESPTTARARRRHTAAERSRARGREHCWTTLPAGLTPAEVEAAVCRHLSAASPPSGVRGGAVHRDGGLLTPLGPMTLDRLDSRSRVYAATVDHWASNAEAVAHAARLGLRLTPVGGAR